MQDEHKNFGLTDPKNPLHKALARIVGVKLGGDTEIIHRAHDPTGIVFRDSDDANTAVAATTE